MEPVLVADIGGATTRFGLVYADGQLRNVSTTINDRTATIDDAIGRYLHACQVRPDAAVLAVAGPVDGDWIAVSNRSWRFRLSELKAAFGFTTVRAVNDLEAVACAIVGRHDCEMRPLGATTPDKRGVKVVVGAGAGLGVAAMLPSDGTRWTIVASEGGHISFGPTSRDEDFLFERMRERYGRLSAAVLSGPGLELIYLAIAPDAEQICAEEIARRAKAGDPTARACIDAFVRLLGRFAGDVVLMFKATAGVYLSGGVAAGIGDLLDAATFRAAYEAHPPYAKLMASIPSFVITCREPGLLGCAALAEQWFGKDRTKP
jgi:glucokinase